MAVGLAWLPVVCENVHFFNIKSLGQLMTSFFLTSSAVYV